MYPKKKTAEHESREFLLGEERKEEPHQSFRLNSTKTKPLIAISLSFSLDLSTTRKKNVKIFT